MPNVTPEIPVDETSIIAYYNPVEEFDLDNWHPEYITDHDNVNEHEVYDNGILITDWDNKRYDIRIKSDGWVTAYLDDTVDEDGGVGPWDVVEIEAGSTPSDFAIRNDVATVCNEIHSDVDIDSDEVYMYDFLNEAENITVIATSISVTGGGSSQDAQETYTVTEGTELELVYGDGDSETNLTSGPSSDIEPDDGIITDDIEFDTEYEIEASGWTDGEVHVTTYVVFFWS